MAISILDNSLFFPKLENANSDGLLAIGGDLSLERLLLAYQQGIFPWYSDGQPILWWSPDPRFILYTDKVKVSKRMKTFIRNCNWDFRINTAFNSVIEKCQKIPRKFQDGTWITDEMKSAYINMNNEGYAISFEVFENESLIGGMYGVLTKKYFAGESMFSLKSNASKVALIKACEFLHNKGIEFIDCQMRSDHLESMGGEFIQRKWFKNYLNS